MSDKKEIATLSIKISVDSTDLDKLEAQLKRIEGLMVSTGLKQPASGGFIANSFDVFKCKGGGVFIPEAHISAASVRQLSELMSDKAKEAIEKIAKQSPTTTMRITTGIDDSREQQSAVAILESSAEISRTSEVISREKSEFEKFKQQVESEFSQFQSSITAIQKTIADSDRAFAGSLERIRSDIQSVKSGWQL